MKFLKLILILGLGLQSACATMVRGTHERVDIASTPEGATAQSDMRAKKLQTYGDGTESQYYGCAPTPCSINFSRRADTVVTMTKPGYDTIKFKVLSTWETGYSAVRSGSIVAGLPSGSHVLAGKVDLMKRIPVQGGMLTSGLFFGVGPIVDIAVGSNLSLSPNPVTVFLAPSSEIGDNNPQEDVK